MLNGRADYDEMADGAWLVRREHRESLDASDPHALLFGPDDRYETDYEQPPDYRGTARGSRSARAWRHEQRRRRRRHRWLAALGVVLVAAIVAGAGWFIVRPFVNNLTTKDWSGPGTGTVLVEVKPNDTAAAIGDTLVKMGVVRTKRAFTNAASENEDSLSIQPGFYRLRKHMSAKLALAMLLDPSSRVETTVTIPEGLTEANVLTKLATALHQPVSALRKASANVANLGIPEGYGSASARPRSAEGFLFPDTYSFDPGTTPIGALQDMVSEFTGVDRDMGFADAAKKLKISPYQALIIASMIEGEAKFADDRAKVAQVIYNRMSKRMPLGIDATSVYGAKLAGQAPSKIDFNKPAPYNTRLKPGLPPTPIGNPGRAALTAAVGPTAGNWLYYVNGDAQGHLYFTSSAADFERAVQRCRDNHWGCS